MPGCPPRGPATRPGAPRRALYHARVALPCLLLTLACSGPSDTGATPSGDACTGCACDPHAAMLCDGTKVWWVDDCGTRTGLKVDCGDKGCWGGECRTCAPDCAGRVCGDDGCGGSCGVCTGFRQCTAYGACCTPACIGVECGDDGCGGSCGECVPPDVCNGTYCVCTGSSCPCIPHCSGQQCGDDGCGGSCGGCVPPFFCNGTFCECTGVDCPCTRDCAGRECGDDGCGWTCGTCPYDDTCLEDGTCCSPSCADRRCGDDGCGGSCGTCQGDTVCADFRCRCTDPDGIFCASGTERRKLLETGASEPAGSCPVEHPCVCGTCQESACLGSGLLSDWYDICEAGDQCCYYYGWIDDMGSDNKAPSCCPASTTCCGDTCCEPDQTCWAFETKMYGSHYLCPHADEDVCRFLDPNNFQTRICPTGTCRSWDYRGLLLPCCPANHYACNEGDLEPGCCESSRTCCAGECCPAGLKCCPGTYPGCCVDPAADCPADGATGCVATEPAVFP